MRTKISFLIGVGLFGLTATTIKAQVGINNTAANPDASAILDLQTGNSGVNKGFLPQAVALTNVNTAAPVTSPATGLIVYSSSAPTGGNGKGYYFWNGSAWASMNYSAGVAGSGTNNYVARWTPNGTTLGRSTLQDDGTGVSIDTTTVTGAALFVNSSTGTGIVGRTDVFSAAGVYGEDDNWIGVEGYATAPGDVGVWGQDDGAGAAGVYGTSSNGTGVEGISGAATLYGVAGFNDFVGAGIGVYGHANTGVSGYGLTYGGQFHDANGDSASLCGNYNYTSYGVYGYGAGSGDVGGYFTSSDGAECWIGDGTYNAGGNFFDNSFAENGRVADGQTGSGIYGSGASFGGDFFSGKGQGVYSSSANAAGDSAVGTTFGVWASSTIGADAGVYGVDDGFGGWGVWGVSNAAEGSGVGGQDYSATGAGVTGDGGTGGVFYGQAKQGVYSNSSAAAADSAVGTTYGVYAYTSDPDGDFSGVYGEDDNDVGVEGYSAYGTGIYGYAANGGTGIFAESSGQPIYAYLDAGNTYGEPIYCVNGISGGYAALCYWSGTTQYKAYGSGTVSTIAKDTKGNDVVLHCTEAPEIYFEDYGEGQLVNGKTHIDLDPTIAKNVTINEKHPLRAYVQLEGDCNGVYVTNKTSDGFDVVELNHGTSNTPFQWHIVCNRADEQMANGKVSHNADVRLEAAQDNSARIAQAAKMQTKNAKMANARKARMAGAPKVANHIVNPIPASGVTKAEVKRTPQQGAPKSAAKATNVAARFAAPVVPANSAIGSQNQPNTQSK